MKKVVFVIALLSLNLIFAHAQSRSDLAVERIESIFKKYELVNSTCTVTFTKNTTQVFLAVRTQTSTITLFTMDRNTLNPPPVAVTLNDDLVMLSSSRGIDPEVSISVIEIPNTGQALVSARQISKGMITTQNCILAPK